LGPSLPYVTWRDAFHPSPHFRLTQNRHPPASALQQARSPRWPGPRPTHDSLHARPPEVSRQRPTTSTRFDVAPTTAGRSDDRPECTAEWAGCRSGAAPRRFLAAQVRVAVSKRLHARRDPIPLRSSPPPR